MAGLLAQWDVEQIQGYYFSRPLPPEQLAEFWNGRPVPELSSESRRHSHDNFDPKGVIL